MHCSAPPTTISGYPLAPFSIIPNHPQPPAPLPSPPLVPVGSWLPRSLVSAILLSSVRCGTKGVGWPVARCGGRRRRLGRSVAERNRSSTEPVAAEVAAAADDDDNNDDGFGIRVARCGGGRWQSSGPRHAGSHVASSPVPEAN